MKRANVVFAAALVAACAVSSAFGAVKVRLIYGESWSPAGRAVKAMLSGSEFKSAAKGRYVAEFFAEEGGKPAPENLGSLKLPVIFVISEAGNCFCVIDNVPQEVTAKQLLAKIRKVDDIRIAAEKEGFTTADKCGEFLQKMERYVGGPRRVVSKGFYENVFNKLKELDPKDETGWQRHFTLGLEFGKSAKADGLELVERANAFREKGQFAEGEAFVTKQQKELSARHLTTEQKQSLLMARFALYRETAERRPEMIALLKRIAEADETTFWGTAALGWLNMLGQPQLSTYWGWHQGDFKGPRLDVTIKYGVGHSFKNPGKYTISFVRGDKSADAPKIDSVRLFAGDEEVAMLSKPKVDGNRTTFDFELKREYRGRLTAMVVRGSAGPEGNSNGRIEIHRDVLRPRK